MIVRDENGFRSSHFGKRGSRRFRRCMIGECGFQRGQVNAEEASLAAFAVHVNKSTVLLDDAIDGDQPHSGPLAAFLGREERFKDPLARCGVHAHAGIGHGKNAVSAGRDQRIGPAVGAVEFHHFGFDQQSPSVRHGVAGVQTQVHQHLLDLRGIGFDCIQRGGDDFDFDILGDDFVEEAEETAGDGVEVHGLRLETLAARKSE